jgi:formylglycine-generating enzyme required for sulfatase activity/uncharacterized caspase-like protein
LESEIGIYTEGSSFLYFSFYICENFVVEKLNTYILMDERLIMKPPQSSDPSEQLGKNFLLVIGIDHYPHHTKLNNAVADAKGFADVMTARYGFTHLVEPLYDAEATQTNIRKAIGKCESLGEHDRLIVFYSGHGWYKSNAKLGYIVPTDAKSDPNSDFVPVNFITDIFRSVDARHILLIVDCCFGGSFGEERNVLNIEMTDKVVKELNTKRSRMVLSSGSIEPVSDGLVSAQNSPFTAPLLEILRSNKQSLTVFSEVFPMLRKKTKWETNQMPQYKVLQGLKHADGELALYCTDMEEETWDNLNKSDKNALNAFISKYPDSDFCPKATAFIEEIEAKDAKKRQEVEANLRIEAEKQAYKNAMANPTVYNLNRFLKDYPLSIYAENIDKRLADAEEEAAWKEAKTQKSITGYRSFMRRFPNNSGLIEEANKRIEALEADLEEAEKKKQPAVEPPKPSVVVETKPVVVTPVIVEKPKEEPAHYINLRPTNRNIKKPNFFEKYKFHLVGGGVLLAFLMWYFMPKNSMPTLLPAPPVVTVDSPKISVKTPETVTSKPEPSTLSVSASFTEPQMVKVEGGSFQMGSNSNQSDEKPEHSVSVSSFYIGKFEVTQAEWRSVMGQNPKELKDFKGDNMPVHSVSWNDIQDFLQKINAKTGKRYRLPTEAEWEFAARGGNKSNNYTYSGSNDVKSVAWMTENAGSKTHTVGGLKANELGIYDMSGNVWEWCQDWYKGYPGSSGVTDYTGSNRVLRGGSWGSSAEGCRSTYRSGNTPTYRGNALGFRLAISSLQ